MNLKIALIFGGKSSEHEVSLRSATSIYNAIDKSKFDIILLGNDKEGLWHINSSYPTNEINLIENDFFQNSTQIYIDRIDDKASIIDKNKHLVLHTFDVAFPIIHGSYGEDGALQGYLKFLNIPFVGSDILASAICMDKEVTKRLLKDSGIPIADYICVSLHEQEQISFAKAKEKLGRPLFIKPCNAGSSVGVSKVLDEKDFKNALTEAFKHDPKVLIEEAIVGKEVECAILGNEDAKASVIGEIVPTKDFYSYDAKYNDTNGAVMKIPAEIDILLQAKLQNIALLAYKATCCKGMARVDFFIKEDGTYVVNEINTLPGFTSISMYPKLWGKSRIAYSDLITELIHLATSNK